MSTISRPPNLGVVVYMLRQCTNQFLHTYEAHKLSMRKLDSITALTPEELKEVAFLCLLIHINTFRSIEMCILSQIGTQDLHVS